ncbi:MAG: site-specific DNA-methyltransferase [Acidobacteriota bacterium]|nr:site-specific DNA-methyltransferase [Acidobacteriota bacterium]
MSTLVRKTKADVLEEKFYDALRDVFVGAKVEGESGYINLMRIKSRYFAEGVFPKLKETVAAELAAFPDFKGELFDKLYTFFQRYFSESGSIYFRHTPLHQNVYERVYTNDRDVMLFWKTHMLYYVKTDRLFRSLTVEPEAEGGPRFHFDASTLQNKKNNEKRELVYAFKGRREADGALAFAVGYSEKGRKTKTEEIVRQIRQEAKVRAGADELERAFRLFERQSEVDYFINRDARQFLEEQFRLWLYQYVFRGENVWTERRVGELQALQRVALKIVDFIAQFENELVKIWNKPKFVRRSNYVITLDRIAERDGALARRLLAHGGMEGQVAEWRELNIVGAGFEAADAWKEDLTGAHLDARYRFLPVDTRHFKELEPEVLALFDDLDAALDGWLIKSENYQALNTILPKFRGRVKCIYIDPPFNKEQDADYFYSVKYKDSTWLTLLENRLNASKELLSKDGSIFVRCDYNGNMLVRLLMNDVFERENFVNQLSVRRVKKNITGQGDLPMPDALDNIYVYFMPEAKYLNIFEEHSRKGFWRRMDDSSGIRRPPERNIFGKTFHPPEGKHFKFSQKKIEEKIERGEVRLKCKNCKYEHYEGAWEGCPACGADQILPEYFVAPSEQKTLDTNWTDIYGYSFDWGFQTENSEKLLARVIETTSEAGHLVLDFFLGSGTTAAVAHKLGRKWVGVETAEHFYAFRQDDGRTSGVLVRMKEVLAGLGSHEPSGISKDVKWQGGGFFKYYELEQYEETLQRAKYEDSTFFDNPFEDPFHSYVFLRDAKLLDAVEVAAGRERVKVDFARLYPDVDAAETLSNLFGKRIKRLAPGEVEFADGEKLNLDDLDFRAVKPLIWWR